MTVTFPLGRVVATPGALKVLVKAGEDPLSLLSRHCSGDWGDVDKHDRKENERVVFHSGMMHLRSRL